MRREWEWDRSGYEVHSRVFGTERTFQRKLRAAARRGAEGLEEFQRQLELRARKAAIREYRPQFENRVADLYGNERTESLLTPPSMAMGLLATTEWALRPPSPISGILTHEQIEALRDRQEHLLARRRGLDHRRLALMVGETLFLLPCARDSMQFLIRWVLTKPQCRRAGEQARGSFHSALSRHLTGLGHPPEGLSPGTLSSRIKTGGKSGLDRTTTMRDAPYQRELYALQLLPPWEKLSFALILNQEERGERALSIAANAGRHKAVLAGFQSRDDGTRLRVVRAYERIVFDMTMIAADCCIDPTSKRKIYWRRSSIPDLVCGHQGLTEKCWGWGGFSAADHLTEAAMAEFGDELLRDPYESSKDALNHLALFGRRELAQDARSDRYA